MIKIARVLEMISNQWREELCDKTLPLPPEARVVTGRQKGDAHLHFLKTQCGLELMLTSDARNVIAYDVIDEEKFTWFVLKWS